MALPEALPEDLQSEVRLQVQLSDILHYAAGGSRLIIEGERVFKANHLLLVGVQTVYDDGLQLFASCLKSSLPSSEPHKICIRTRFSFENWTFQCSCKAGLGKCKHVMAVLNHLLMHPSIPILTVTDMQQKWGKVASKVAGDMYKAIRISEFCHNNHNSSGKQPETTKDPNEVQLDIPLKEEETLSILDCFLKKFPESSLSYELNGRPRLRENIENSIGDETINVSLLDEFLDLQVTPRSASMESLISFEDSSESSVLTQFLKAAFCNDRHTTTDLENLYFIGPLDAHLSLFYELQVSVSESESIQICLDTLDQRISPIWTTERSRRITASNAYSLYTYYSSNSDKLKNWRKKIINLIMPKEIHTSAIDHGIRCETLAINVYMRDFKKIVTKCGFTIPPHIPWLGCSPDGIIIDERKVIEVKCPIVGSNLSLNETLEKLQYLTKHGKTLKKNHQYYLQVQLSMFILKCTSADFIIYSEHEDKCNVQTILYDEEYLQPIVCCLKEVYFNAFLKVLYTTHNKSL